MTLGDFIKLHRENKGISQRQFAALCGVSNGYISMLEDGKNPKTKEPIVPNVFTLKKISTAMGITLHELLCSVDDMPIDLTLLAQSSELAFSERERLLLELFRKMSEEKQSSFLEIAQIYANG